MFTGLIETLGSVHRVETEGSGLNLRVAAGVLGLETKTGDSIAINGACLTVIEREGAILRFQVGPETLRLTNLGQLAPGDRVNLERPLRLSDRLGGHLVQGHVDGIGRVAERIPQSGKDGEPNWELVLFTCPPDLAAQLVPKGSVAVDGISLTVVDVAADRFSVALIPHTLKQTTLGSRPPGSAVNIETDLISKYVAKYLHHFRAVGQASEL
jgi:riboflavin synthase